MIFMMRRSFVYLITLSILGSTGFSNANDANGLPSFSQADLDHNDVINRDEYTAIVMTDDKKNKEGGEDARPPPQPLIHSSTFDHVLKNVGFSSAFVSGLGTIWATEVGDKTFFIAAILSMRHDRLVVFFGAIGALIVMTVLSVVLGGMVGYFLPVEMTHYAGTILFVGFGLQMLHQSRTMDGSSPSDELAEVEEELESKKTSEDAVMLEDGDAKAGSDASKDVAQLKHVMDSKCKVLTQAFIMTFLAEWGDRSQIATITLATTKNALGVTLGAIIGHSMCTGLAVVGGKLLASRISEKTVTCIGGVLFLLFGAHSLITGPPLV